jgi:energy-coupling factor transporter ATP-binding protein EcfA2
MNLGGVEVDTSDWPPTFRQSLAGELGRRVVSAVLVHAGTASFREGCLLVPGSSGAGKTTLVSALLDLGARFMSDEYALVQADGRVVAFPRPLCQKRDGQFFWVAPHALVEEHPQPVAAIAAVRFDGVQSLRRLGPGEGMMALLSHALSIRSEPARCLSHLSSATRHTRFVVEGTRGESQEFAAWLVGAAGLTPY